MSTATLELVVQLLVSRSRFDRTPYGMKRNKMRTFKDKEIAFKGRQKIFLIRASFASRHEED